MKKNDICKDILLGIAIGDALGVPFEFKSRQAIATNPVVVMVGFGTYYLPEGTWSDDSSLTFCLAEALTQEFDLNTIADNFIKWMNESYWSPYGNVFDIGITTSQTISKLKTGIQPELAGGIATSDNGNGSLMRILPLLVYIKDKPSDERYQITKLVSSITHGHIRSIISCFYYIEFALQILRGFDKFSAYNQLKTNRNNFLKSESLPEVELLYFDRLLIGNIYELEADSISSTGYVLHTLEASIWCLLTTNNYEEAVLKAVNLDLDTDTTAAVTGGLAGLLYGYDSIPKNWINQLARKDDILDLAERLKIFTEKLRS